MTTMNAEERAQYLFDLFSFVEFSSDEKTLKTRKACALVLLRETMKDIDIKSRDFIYWLNVRQKLEEI
ncbi:MAG: hypothetical protein EBR91_08135 [Flavobacteriia bacterium]|jgi:hypothetical protein|nr:hypothetical protein [Flavobacteriia bacterium]